MFNSAKLFLGGINNSNFSLWKVEEKLIEIREYGTSYTLFLSKENLTPSHVVSSNIHEKNNRHCL